MAFSVASIIDRSAVLLNDSAKSIYTYDVQLPYVKVAYDELKLRFEEDNIPYTNEVTAAVKITTGAVSMTTPSDMIEPLTLYEKTYGSDEVYQEMSRRDFLPENINQINALVYWAWQGQSINFIGATSDRSVKIHYTGDIFGNIVGTTSTVYVINSFMFLAHRTAGLVAELVEENKEKADSLNGMAAAYLDSVINTATKGKQATVTRRRPFMASYKARGGM